MTNEIKEIITEFVASILLDKGIPLEMYKDKPYVGLGYYDGIEGFYFNYPNYTGHFDFEKVSRLFPLGVGDYTVFLANISEPEIEDDRMYAASIGFIAHYND